MTIQENMIGKHPQNGFFFDWLECSDTICTETKRHRSLMAKDNYYKKAVNTVANWLVTYHLSNGNRNNLIRKKQILEKYEFLDYAKKLEIFPKKDKTKKGNFGEIILTEYLSESSGIKVLIYKLHYNPNVDQSMKGDDVLLVDSNHILVGESKFRKNSNKQAVDKACESMNDSLKLPLSLGFIADCLFDQGDIKLADIIYDIKEKIIDSNYNKIDIKNIAFLLSDKNVVNYVEKNINFKNNNLIFVSLGIEDPVEFMEDSFKEAEKLLPVVSNSGI